MANINDLIPKLRRNPITGKIEEEPVVIDDAFDPLFNRRAKATIQNRYGINPLLTPVYGYADFLDTVFAPKQEGKWGVLGPAMGILGGFGRTLDKAEDFLLGGLTEGVNSLNQVNPFSTAPTTPVNPFTNIFVEDQDYTGEKLFAAMGNSINKLAGGTVLNEHDFEDTTWKPAALATELLTDPGIAGGIMSKAGKSADLLSQVANASIPSRTQQIGQLLSNYDDIVTKGAWDVTVPGLRPAIKSQLHRMRQFLSVNSEKAIQNVPLNYSDTTDDINKIVEKEYFNAQERWNNAIKNSGIENANANEMPVILDHLEQELKDIDDIVVKKGLADDEYIKQSKEIRDAINDAKMILLNPKDTQNIITNDVATKVNKILTDNAINKLDFKRQNRAVKDVTRAYKKAGIIKGSGEAMSFKTNRRVKLYEDNLTKNISKNPDYYSEMLDKAMDIDLPEAYKDMELSSIGKEIENSSSSNAVYIYKKIQAILNGEYYEDNWINNRVARNIQNYLNETSSGGHKVFLTTSLYNNANSEIGNTVVKRIRNYNDIDFTKFKDYITNQEQQLQWSFNPSKKYNVPNRFKNTIDDFIAALKNPNIPNKEFLDLSNDMYDYINYIQKRYGYQGMKIEEKLNDFKDMLRKNIDLGLYGTGVSKANSIGSMQTIAKQSNEAFNYYEDPWLNEFGRVDIRRYAKAKNDLHKNKLLDLMISPSETFDMADVIKQSPRYTGLSKKSKEAINKELYQLYRATLQKSYWGVKPLDSIEFIRKNKLYTQGINNMSNDVIKYQSRLKELNTELKEQYKILNNMSQDDIFKNIQNQSIESIKNNINIVKSNIDEVSNPFLSKGFDELTDYQQDFIRKMMKDYNIPTMTYKDYLYKLKNNPSSLVIAPPKMGDYGDFSSTGLTLSGSDIDPFVIGKSSKQKAKEAATKELKKSLTVEKTIDVEKVKNILTTLDNADFSKYIFNSSLETDSLKADILNDVIDKGYNENYVRDLEWLLNKELSEPYKYIKGDYATTRIQGVQDILKSFDNISQKYGLNTEDFDMLSDAEKKARYRNYFKHTEMYLNWRDLLNDDIVRKESFINDLFSSGGITVGVFDKIKNKANFEAAERAIINNLTVINKQFNSKRPFINLIENETKDGKVVLGYALNTENLNAVKDFAKANIDTSKLQDVVFALKDEARAKEIYDAFKLEKDAQFTFEELDDLFNKSQEISRDLSRKIGYTEFSDDYFKHAIAYSSNNKNAEKWLSSYVYRGIKQDDLTDLVQTIQAYQKAGNQKAYGITPVTRRLRGPISTWNNLSAGTYVFSVDPGNIVKKTFSEGIFNNSNFQTHIGLFMNDNFRISSYTKSIDDLKNILYVKKNGDFTGNMDNLLLAAPRYSKEGRIIGFQQFDKLSDEGLQAALKNPETILVPTHLLAPLDKMLRKDMKMSNKVYAFINKYFTIPVKFGTLTNLGFLVGNMGDAGFKQAVTLSRKYGTSIPYELARVADSVKNTIVLNNKFANTFTKYVDDIKKSMGNKFIDYYSLTDSLISTPKARQNFEEWISKAASTGEISQGEVNIANLWLFLNNKENTSIFKGDFQNLGDLVQRKSKYAPPKNLVERLLTGDKVMLDTGDVKTYYGLFAGNPVTEKILNTSGTIESVARSASILNDLTRHYGSKEIYQILGDPETYNKEFRRLNVKALDAINVMSTANFDYNYMNDLTDRFATFVPFPTFVVKNYAYWMDIMINKPELMDSIITMQNVAWRGKETEKDQFQAEAKGRGAIPLSTSKNSKLKGIFKPTPTQSMFSAFDVMQNPLQNVAFRTNPLLHPITHHLQSAEDDRYRPYSTDPYEKNIKRSSPEYNALAATFHRLNPYERTVNTWLRTPSKLFSEHNAQISDFVPSVFQPDFSTKSNTKNKKR